MISPADCTVVTEVMPTWRALWVQRLRWQRGALENLGAYGMRPQTFRYWAQQLGHRLRRHRADQLPAPDRGAWWSRSTHWVWFPFWLGIGLLFVVERVLTVWRGGLRARLLAVTLFPEMFFALVLNLIYREGDHRPDPGTPGILAPLVDTRGDHPAEVSKR